MIKPAQMKLNMKNKSRLSFCCQSASAGLFFGLLILCCASASAQLLKNGNFDSEFPVADPTAGWAIVYVTPPGSLSIAGHTTQAARTGQGAHLRAAYSGDVGSVHAYFKQVVTNLTEGASYTLTIQKMKAGFQNYVDTGKLKVYTSVISGTTSNAVSGDGTIDGPYTVPITVAASRQIEVQLHMSTAALASDTAEDFKSSKTSGWFDDYSLALTP
jgi:hypothetical protein